MRARTFVALLVLNAGCATALGAQSRSNAFIDVTAGAYVLRTFTPLNGGYDEDGNLVAFLAFGNQPDASRPLLAALYFGLFPVLGSNTSCDFTPLGGCLRDSPLGTVIAITVGARPLTSPWSALELTAGPALFGALTTRNSFGILTIGRIGLPPGRYLSPGLALHAIVAPYDGDLVFAGGFGFSLRTW
jgi:hypothetical protein